MNDLRCPRGFEGSRWREHFHIGAEVCEQDLSVWKREQMSVKGCVVGSIRRPSNLSKIGSIPLEKGSGRIKEDTSHGQHLAIRLDAGRPISDTDLAWEVWTGFPLAVRRLVNRRVAGTATVSGARSENRAVRP